MALERDVRNLAAMKKALRDPKISTGGRLKIQEAAAKLAALIQRQQRALLAKQRTLH